MKKIGVLALFSLLVTATMALMACSQPSPAATPAPATAAEPTKAPAAASPTKAAAAPAESKTAFPEKGKSVTMIVPYGAGGGSDTSARVLVGPLEKQLGVPVQVVNRDGAGSQVGMTEVANSKPDGYTLGYGLWPALITIYLDPERKAAFNRASFEPVALHVVDPGVIAVRSDSPYQSLKDLVDAAKANPDTIKVSDNGLLNPEHLALLSIQKQTGAKFAIGHFSGASQSVTALLGGHTDAAAGGLGPFISHLKSGKVRLLAILDDNESSYAPGVTTAKSQGYDIKTASARGFVVPAGTPKDVIAVLDESLKKAMESDEHTKRMEELGQTTRYMSASDFAKYWDEMEADIKPLLEEALKEAKN